MNPRPFEGLPLAFNVREVVRGRLYRSAEPVMLEAGAWEQFVAGARLQTIIDLRMPQERIARGIPAAVPGLVNLSLPLFNEVRSGWENPEDGRPQATALRYHEMLNQGRTTVVSIVRLLGTPATGPALIHCAAGRDRTGMVVACVLTLLGVEDEIIAADYHLSDGVVGDGHSAEPETMLGLLNLLRQSGSMEEAMAPWGLTRDDLSALRKNLIPGS